MAGIGKPDSCITHSCSPADLYASCSYFGSSYFHGCNAEYELEAGIEKPKSCINTHGTAELCVTLAHIPGLLSSTAPIPIQSMIFYVKAQNGSCISFEVILMFKPNNCAIFQCQLSCSDLLPGSDGIFNIYSLFWFLVCRLWFHCLDNKNWSFARKFPVVEQPKCGAKNIPRIFRRGQTSSGLPPVDSSFGSIWKLFQIDPLRHHGDHPP